MGQAPRNWEHLSSDDKEQLWATLALRHAQGLGARTCNRLINAYGSAYSAIAHVTEWPKEGISASVQAQITSGAWRKSALEEWNNLQNIDAHIIMRHDTVYPASLKEIPDAPALLYCLGDLSLFKAPAVAMVGSRNCTAEGVRVAENIAEGLASCGITIVSGMAVGIDRVAHVAALGQVGKSIAVLGTGIDVVYPPKNKDIFAMLGEEGLIVSEFAPSAKPLTAHFPIRNRIISGLSLGVLIVEAAMRSGSLITARLALEQNRSVYAIPGPASIAASLGCQDLIRKGAHPIFNAEDILKDLKTQLEEFDILKANVLACNGIRGENVSKRKSKISPLGQERKTQDMSILDSDCKRILSVFQDGTSHHVDKICLETQLTAQSVSSGLIQLEMHGFIKREPGAFYRAI